MNHSTYSEIDILDFSNATQWSLPNNATCHTSRVTSEI
jgi:hypothetical protein